MFKAILVDVQLCTDEDNALALHEEERLSSQEKKKVLFPFFKNPLDVVRGKSSEFVNII